MRARGSMRALAVLSAVQPCAATKSSVTMYLMATDLMADRALDILGRVQHVGARVAHRGAHLPCEYGELPQVLAHFLPALSQFGGELLGLLHDVGRDVHRGLAGCLNVLGGRLARFDNSQG